MLFAEINCLSVTVIQKSTDQQRKKVAENDVFRKKDTFVLRLLNPRHLRIKLIFRSSISGLSSVTKCFTGHQFGCRLTKRYIKSLSVMKLHSKLGHIVMGNLTKSYYTYSTYDFSFSSVFAAMIHSFDTVSFPASRSCK